MDGTHVTEAIWFDARRLLPNSNREVLVVFAHYGTSTVPKRYMGIGVLERSANWRWKVMHELWNPSCDCVTQWAEIDPNRGGCLPDMFHQEVRTIQFIGNTQ